MYKYYQFFLIRTCFKPCNLVILKYNFIKVSMFKKKKKEGACTKKKLYIYLLKLSYKLINPQN